MVQKVEVVVFWLWVNLSSFLWMTLYWLLDLIPQPVIEFLDDTHTLNVFKGGTAYILGLFLVVSKGYDVLSKRRKFKAEASTKSYFDAYIITGNKLREGKHYESAIISYTEALDLNFNNEAAQEKINEVKHLMQIGK
jgi:hypothetical protein